MVVVARLKQLISRQYVHHGEQVSIERCPVLAFALGIRNTPPKAHWISCTF
jgi:hypothetical protein